MRWLCGARVLNMLPVCQPWHLPLEEPVIRRHGEGQGFETPLELQGSQVGRQGRELGLSNKELGEGLPCGWLRPPRLHLEAQVQCRSLPGFPENEALRAEIPYDSSNQNGQLGDWECSPVVEHMQVQDPRFIPSNARWEKISSWVVFINSS